MKKLQFEYKMVEVKKLKPFEKNPRILNQSKFENLKEKIKKQGYANPIILFNDMTICSGHQRAKACEELGINKIPANIIQEKLSKKERSALVLGLNNHVASFDWESMVQNFEKDLLLESGFDEYILEQYLDISEEQEKKMENKFKEKNKEVDLEELEESLSHECPRCKYKFNA